MIKYLFLLVALTGCASTKQEVKFNPIGADARRICSEDHEGIDPVVQCAVTYPEKTYLVFCSCNMLRSESEN